MWNLMLLTGFLFVLALLLVHYKPRAAATQEGFTIVGVDETVAPACIARSTAAQRLLSRIADIPETDTDAAELRVLVSKLCCLEADIASPAAGVIRTLPTRFYTSHDMDATSNIVASCRAAALSDRDIALIQEKFKRRANELIGALICSSEAAEARKEFAEVAERLQWAFTSFCRVPAPTMDKPSGARDPGFWAAEESDLEQYKGISAAAK